MPASYTDVGEKRKLDATAYRPNERNHIAGRCARLPMLVGGKPQVDELLNKFLQGFNLLGQHGGRGNKAPIAQCK